MTHAPPKRLRVNQSQALHRAIFDGRYLVLANHTKDAARQAPQRVWVDLISASEVVDDVGDRTAALRVPYVLGKLVVLDGGSVRSPSPAGTQIHT